MPACIELADAKRLGDREKRAVINAPIGTPDDAARRVLTREVVDDAGEGHRVAAVTGIDEHLPEAVPEEAVAPVANRRVQRLVPDRDGAGKGHVVVGTTDRDERRNQRRQPLGDALEHRHRVQGIGRERQVGAVLLGRPDRQDDAVDAAGEELGDFRRGQFREPMRAKLRQCPLRRAIDAERRCRWARRTSGIFPASVKPILNQCAISRPIGSMITCCAALLRRRARKPSERAERLK